MPIFGDPDKSRTPLAPLIRKRSYPKPPAVPLVRATNDRTRGTGYTRAGTTASPEAYAAWAMTVPGSAPWIQGTPAYDYFHPATGGGAPPPIAAAAPATLPPLHEIKWKKADFDIPGGRAPSWWVNLIPKDLKNVERPDVSSLMMLNTLIPYLSPEDQYNAAAQLYTTAADAFSYYKSEKLGKTLPIDEESIRRSSQEGLTSVDPAYFTSTQRAQDALNALSNMRQASVKGNRWKLGPGYTWLQNITGALQRFGGVGGERMSRVQEQGLMGALDPLLAQGQSGEIGPVASIGRMLSTPFFSQDQLFKKRQTQTGQQFLGGISPYLFS